VSTAILDAFKASKTLHAGEEYPKQYHELGNVNKVCGKNFPGTGYDLGSR
jgi:hypothetical protein